MKIEELIRIKEADLVNRLKLMDTDELETHARTLIKELGSENYSGLMKTVMNTLEENPNTEQRFAVVQDTIRDFLPNQAIMSDIYARLAAILMMIISRRFKTIYQRS